MEDVFDYPANFARVGTRPSGARTTACTLVDVASGACSPKPDSLVHWTPIEDASVFVRGWRNAYGLSAAGGTDRTQYFLGGDYTREQGVYTNNFVRKQGIRANVNGQLAPNAEFSAKLGYNQVRARLPQNDNNDLSPIANSVLGSAFDNPVTRGYLFYEPSLYGQIGTDQSVERVTASLNGTWRPSSWLSLVALGGVDYAGRTDRSIVPPGLIPGSRRSLHWPGDVEPVRALDLHRECKRDGVVATVRERRGQHHGGDAVQSGDPAWDAGVRSRACGGDRLARRRDQRLRRRRTEPGDRHARRRRATAPRLARQVLLHGVAAR